MTPEADGAAALLDAAPAVIGSTSAPVLRLGAWEGPLDRLLELARAQRVDLAPLSPAALAEQVEAAVTAAIVARQVPLPRLADWLERRPQLGRPVFGRGLTDPASATPAGAAPVADPAALLQACLVLLALPPRDRVYRPQPPALWRVPEALARLRGMLPGLGEGADLVSFLPPPSDEKVRSRLQRRAALASTLLAGLELSREGSATLTQEAAFGAIRLLPGKPRP